MPDATERAERYRRRARELRALVEDWKNQETRAMLLRIADDYERLASLLDSATALALKPRGTPPDAVKA